LAINKIFIENFKSFNTLDVMLSNFNVLIGPNASGKSNFISIFKFLRDLVNYGLCDAMARQGDIEYFRNVNLGSTKNFILEITADNKIKYGFSRGSRGKYYGLKTNYIKYKIELEFYKRKSDFIIRKDILDVKCMFVNLVMNKRKLQEGDPIGDCEYSIVKENKRIKYNFIKWPETLKIKKEDVFPMAISKMRLENDKEILIQTPAFIIPLGINRMFDDITIYYIDPRLSKETTPISGKCELEEDGRNLAFVLKNILNDKEKKRKFYNLLHDILPFVEDVDFEKMLNKTLLFKLKEKYFNTKYLPSFLISDGTINIIALLVALYFENKGSVSLFEEPERNMHPYLVSRILDMMKEVSLKKQIIITTHNTEIVKHVDVNDILLIKRAADGFSNITKAIENKYVQKFITTEMESSISLEDLFIENKFD